MRIFRYLLKVKKLRHLALIKRHTFIKHNILFAANIFKHIEYYKLFVLFVTAHYFF